MEFLEWIKELDSSLLLYINGLHNPFWDHTMYIITRKEIWILFYSVLLWTLYRSYGARIIYIIAIVALTVLATDQTCNLFKDFFQRPRPGHDPVIGDLVYIFFKKGGHFGFVSGHSGNSFALVALMWGLLKNRTLYISMFIWATWVAISRVWLGVHYPGDILCGGVIGYAIGHGIFKLAAYLEPSIYKKGTPLLRECRVSNGDIQPLLITLPLYILILLGINYLYIIKGYIG